MSNEVITQEMLNEKIYSLFLNMYRASLDKIEKTDPTDAYKEGLEAAYSIFNFKFDTAEKSEEYLTGLSDAINLSGFYLMEAISKVSYDDDYQEENIIREGTSN